MMAMLEMSSRMDDSSSSMSGSCCCSLVFICNGKIEESSDGRLGKLDNERIGWFQQATGGDSIGDGSGAVQ